MELTSIVEAELLSHNLLFKKYNKNVNQKCRTVLLENAPFEYYFFVFLFFVKMFYLFFFYRK